MKSTLEQKFNSMLFLQDLGHYQFDVEIDMIREFQQTLRNLNNQ